jgi:hypothetical protein
MAIIFFKNMPKFLIFCLFLYACNQGDDARAWQLVMNSPSLDAMDTFLLKYPDSGYKEAALQKKEDFLWQSAINDNTEFGFKNYQKIYPTGKFSELVQLKIDSILTDDIGLASLTSRTFVGKMNVNGKEIMVLSMRFIKIEEAEIVRFEVTINTSDTRKNLLGTIDKNKAVFKFEENGLTPVLGLTTARAYLRDKQIWLESTDINQFWRLRCDL